MAAKKGGLGRGLDSLFADTTGVVSGAAPSLLSLSEIEPDADQPRKSFEAGALAELAASIEEHGLLQPIVVRPDKAGAGYRIIAGERRFRAARMAGLTEIPAIIKEVEENTAMEMAMVENLQRENLGPVEEARGYRQLMERCGLTQGEAAQKVGKSRPVVTNSLRLLKLSPAVLALLEAGKITTGHAKVLLSLEEEGMQEQAAKLVIEQQLSVRETETLVKKMKKAPPAAKEVFRPSLPVEVEASLHNILGTRVRVSYQNGKGTLQVSFSSDEELTRYAKMLGGEEERILQKMERTKEKQG